jgi:predicted TIM-barrel fold metal-dependent hydrolase
LSPPLPTHAPRLQAPADTCDTHMHCYAARYPRHPDGPPPPPDAPPADYRALMGALGIGRVVVVQPNAYGDDNRCTLDAVAELGLARARAVVAIRPGIDDAALQAMHAAVFVNCALNSDEVRDVNRVLDLLGAEVSEGVQSIMDDVMNAQGGMSDRSVNIRIERANTFLSKVQQYESLLKKANFKTSAGG